MRRRTPAAVLVVVVAVAAAALIVRTRAEPGPVEVAAPSSTTTTTTLPAPPPPVAPRTVIATVTGPLEFHEAPGGAVAGTLPTGRWWHDTKHLPVIEARPGWLHVRLPQRPNGLTGWVRSADATLSSTTYGIVIELGRRWVGLYDEGVLVAEFPAGVGTEATPTPTGDFAVLQISEAPSRGWGPFIVDTTAHSEAIQSWQGTGDAFIALHGPLGADATIGEDGAELSNGCVRLHHDHLAALWPVPPGAPVRIVA